MTAHSLPTADVVPTARVDPAGRDKPSDDDGRAHQVQVSWGGDLDIASAPVLSSALLVLVDLRVRTVLLDLSAVAFMDCAGLSTLLDVDRRLAGGLRLARPSRAVLRLLGLVDLAGRLPTPQVPAPPVSVRDTVATIEQSKGLVMAGFRCTADQATKILLTAALRHNVQVQVLSALLVTVCAADLGHPHGGQAQAVRRVVGATDGTR